MDVPVNADQPLARRVRGGCIGLALVLSASRLVAAELPSGVPDWAYPVNPPATPAPPPDTVAPLRLPHSDRSFTRAQLTDLNFAPDWHPGSHAEPPAVVLRGRAPQLYACGYCHMPGGQGRPENAALAGLPAAYISQQVADMRSGARRSARHGAYLPMDLMLQVAANASDAEVARAATYFSALRLTPRVEVRERADVPVYQVRGWVYVARPGKRTEPLGQRLLEFTPDLLRHEMRDDRLRYVAYVPPGSLQRGKTLANSGPAGIVTACVSCHGADLRGLGLVPPLAGRSPSYLLRQLLAFRTGDRKGLGGQPMQPIVALLDTGQMIDCAAYAASLPP